MRIVYLSVPSSIPNSNTRSNHTAFLYTRLSSTSAITNNDNISVDTTKIGHLSYKFHELLYIPDWPHVIYSDAILDTVGGDDILIYTNMLPNITSIGNHLSPLLVQIPCPAHMFGRSRMDIPYTDLADKTRIMTTHTWEIENPQFSTLAPGVNLDDMLVSVANLYGDKLHLGVMDILLERKSDIVVTGTSYHMCCITNHIITAITAAAAYTITTQYIYNLPVLVLV